jgi:hypothetical protein
MPSRNGHLEIFRVKVAMLMDQYTDRLKLFVAENKLMGASPASLKDQREREFSRWTMNRDKLGKDIKHEVAGLVNKVYLTAYLGGFGEKKA